MKANVQFSIATHLLTCLANRPGEPLTSELLAHSVNTSPSFVRRTLSKLAKAGLVKTSMGKGGACTLNRPAARISMFDIYSAVEAPEVFAVHQYEDQKQCPISCKIKSPMKKLLDKAQTAMEDSLKKVTLADMVSEVQKK